MSLSTTEVLSIVVGYYFFLHSLQFFLDEYLEWKPRVFFDVNEAEWSEYQLRCSNSLYPKSCTNREKNTRIAKQASVRVLLAVSWTICTVMTVSTFGTDAGKWKRVFGGHKDIDGWRTIDIVVVLFFTVYVHIMSVNTATPTQWSATAHHVISILAAAQVISGAYFFTIAVWYAFCGQILIFPIDIAKVLFMRYAVDFPLLTRRALKFAVVWYALVAIVCNAAGCLTILVGYARLGHYLDIGWALLCICVWAYDDRFYFGWLCTVAQIDYHIGVHSAVGVKANSDYGPQHAKDADDKL